MSLSAEISKTDGAAHHNGNGARGGEPRCANGNDQDNIVHLGLLREKEPMVLTIGHGSACAGHLEGESSHCGGACTFSTR